MTIMQSAAQDLFFGATITASVAANPVTYDVTLLGAMLPAWRIRWVVKTVTITWTLATAMRGDVFVLPMSNLSTGFATLTNGLGLSQPLTMAVLDGMGIPRTTVVDLTILTPNATTRTSNVWNLVIVNNPLNVVLGAAASLYGPKTGFGTGGGFLLGVNRRKKAGVLKTGNPSYLSDFRLSLQTGQRLYDVTTLSNPTDADMLEAVFDGTLGGAYPGLLWINETLNDALYGYWGDEFSRKQNDSKDIEQIATTFVELSKGLRTL